MIRRSVKLDDRCLLFFVKNPEKGKVKSRLAAVIGDDSAVSALQKSCGPDAFNIKERNLSTLYLLLPEERSEAY